MTKAADQPAKPAKKKETTGEIIRSFLFMVLLALVFRSVAYEPFHIPSGSMLSTLYEGDYIFVSKFSYGYSRYSFPFSPKLFEGRIWKTEPKRGDVVVFRNPNDLGKDYIKRIIGLPGETIQVTRGRLYINGTMVDQTRRGEVNLPGACGNLRAVERYDETLPGGHTHTVLDDSNVLDDLNNRCSAEVEARMRVLQGMRLDADNTREYTVPAGHYFMMGDNRDHSQDSRFSPELGYEDAPGYVPFENIVGRADIIAFSLKGLGGRWFKRIE
ncbi:MAG: signal peptidase I [Alphaproteobacteria bacterium]|nr:signal peptidase I [Alphaproteobacteria bacterium]